MKYLQRYLSLLFALVMCVGAFSITAHAEMQDFDDSHIYISTTLQTTWGAHELIIFPNNDSLESDNVSFTVPAGSTGVPGVLQSSYIKRDNGKVLFQSGRKLKFWINNFRSNCLVKVGTKSNYSYGNFMSVVVTFTDGSLRYLTTDEYTLTMKNGAGSIAFEFTPEKDIADIAYHTRVDFSSNETYLHAKNNNLSYSVDVFVGELDNTSYNIQFDQSTEEAGLLEDIKNGISNLITSIIELPLKIWEKIENGLKSLFVPSEESMTAYKDKWDELLASRFGAVYQVVNIITDSWDGIMQADLTGVIEFPQASINILGTSFTFGGYDVKVIPDGFEVLVEPLKFIVGIVCTVTFVDAMRKRYDEIMGVEQ